MILSLFQKIYYFVINSILSGFSFLFCLLFPHFIFINIDILCTLLISFQVLRILQTLTCSFLLHMYYITSVILVTLPISLVKNLVLRAISFFH
jgi:hypothetical protein